MIWSGNCLFIHKSHDSLQKFTKKFCQMTMLKWELESTLVRSISTRKQTLLSCKFAGTLLHSCWAKSATPCDWQECKQLVYFYVIAFLEVRIQSESQKPWYTHRINTRLSTKGNRSSVMHISQRPNTVGYTIKRIWKTLKQLQKDCVSCPQGKFEFLCTAHALRQPFIQMYKLETSNISVNSYTNFQSK